MSHLTFAAAARLLLYAGATLAIGDVAVRWIGLASADRAALPEADRLAMPALEPDNARAADASRRTVRLRLAGWVSLLVAVCALLVLQARDMELEPTASALRMLLSGTTWGRGWSLLALSAALGATACAWRAPRAILASCALLLAVAMGGLGHAAADDALPQWSRLVDAAHVLGVGAWIGALVLMPARASTSDWARYSRLATVAAPMVVLSGVLAALRRLAIAPLDAGALYPTTLAVILTSDYGRLLLLKSGLVLLVLGFGLKHRRRVLREHAPSRSSVATELTIAVMVFAVTAVLTGTAPPGE